MKRPSAMGDSGEGERTTPGALVTRPVPRAGKHRLEAGGYGAVGGGGLEPFPPLHDSRPLFGVERVWLAADRSGPPFVNQFVVELDGEVDPMALEAAIATVLPAWPAARARLTGWLASARWTADGAPPRVRAASDDESVRLDPHTGPIVEWVFGPAPDGGTRLVLRTHHAAFDGRAAWALAEDLGAALRGEPIRGAAFATVVEPPGGKVTPEPPADARLPTGASSGATGTAWERFTLPTAGAGVLPRVLVALAVAAGGTLRLSVPVDLRPLLPASEQRAAANLTGFVTVTVAPDDDVRGLAEHLRELRAGTGALNVLRTADSVRGVPLWLMSWVARRGAAEAARRGKSTASGVVSNLGRLDAHVFDHPGCSGRACFWIPPTNPGTPLFVTLTGHSYGLEVVVGMPNAYGDGGRLSAFVGAVGAAMGGANVEDPK